MTDKSRATGMKIANEISGLNHEIGGYLGSENGFEVPAKQGEKVMLAAEKIAKDTKSIAKEAVETVSRN